MANRPFGILVWLLLGAPVVGVLLFLLIGRAPAPPPSEPAAVSQAPPVQRESVVLTLGSWRTQDIEQMTGILNRFHEAHPRITIRFDPINAPEYNDALQAQLAGGTGPDLFYLRSYSTSRMQYEKGYLTALDQLPGLTENFAPDMRAPWTGADGVAYGVPFIATSHGIYYNQDLFETLGLAVPESWQALMEVAEAIRAAGTIPFANTSGDAWTVAEIIFMNLAPGFIGGRAGRMAYLNGERCFNDPRMTAAFRAVGELAPFLPRNHELLTYNDSLQLFVQGRAAMYMGGSWDIPFFEAVGTAFHWSVFATPPPAGSRGCVTFHLDAAVGLNAASRHKAEAMVFLEWLTTPACGALLGNALPGFFPMHREPPTLTNPHANAFLALNQGRGTDVRFAWEKLRDGSPDGYLLIQDGALAVLRGRRSAGQAADALQAGLARWFDPARNCAP